VLNLHPDLLRVLANERTEAEQHATDRQRHLPQRARPPGRVRTATAHGLARLASRLAREPVVVGPRRA
jgi:hypothetical protein